MNMKQFQEDRHAEDTTDKKKGQIIWLHGYPCSGKTFTGDYLATIGWYNVDGDWFARATDPKDIIMAKKLVEGISKICHNEPMSEEHMQNMKTHLKDLCDKAIKSAESGVDTAVSFICYTKWQRDYIKTLIPDIKIVHIKVDVSILLPKNRNRITKAMSHHGMTLKQMWD